jgi:alginate O-acetyltransferase complex protein AlgI
MGYELRINFLQPYFSRSIGEFWHRWHISLSTWFRDYLYIPLGGNRVRLPRYLFNVFITFALSGLWHGANWTFIIWGGLHGFYLMVSKLTASWREAFAEATGLARLPRLRAVLQLIITLVLVTVAWVFFRANSVSSAFYVVRHIIPHGAFRNTVILAANLPRANTPFLVFFIAMMFLVEWFISHPSRNPRIWNSLVTRYAAYYAVAFTIIFFGVFGHTDFIYFQF